jgi:hypothetical protein
MNSVTYQRERIFGKAEDVLVETKRLGRLIELDLVLQHLPFPHRRGPTLEKVSIVWEEMLKNPIKSVEKFKQEIFNQQDSALTIRGKKSPFPLYMQQKIEPATSVKSIQKIGNTILQDCSSATKTPVKRTESGLKGPTLLVDFPFSNLEDEFGMIAYVLKWVKKEEMAGNLLYSAFANWFGRISSIGFSVPKNSGFDFKNHLHKNSEEIVFPLENPISQKLKKSFSSILLSLDPTQSTPNLQPKGDQVMVMDRIQGENLFDFARVKYPLLTTVEQKREIFIKLGKLVPLDLLFGHLDRLVKLFVKDDEYSLAPIASNVGNVMIAPTVPDENSMQDGQSDDLTVYAIDNGVKFKLIENSKRKVNYLEFIANLFKKEHPEKEIARAVIDSLESGFKATADDQPNVETALKELQSILQDLHQKDGSPGIALAYLEEGIKEMFDILRNNLSFAWNSAETGPLKETLSILHPALLETLDERIQTIYETLPRKEPK